MSASLYALPSDDLITAAALSATNQDAAYPIANAQNEDSADTFKATGTSSVITITVPSSTPVAFALINTSATSAALTNGAGMASQALTFPSRTTDGKQRNGWKNMTGVASRTSTVFTLTVSKTGSAVLEIGRIVLVVALRDLLWMYGLAFGIKRPGSIDNVTRLGSRSRRLSPVSQRTAVGAIRRHTELANWLELEAQGNGLGKGFLLIPEQTVNDAWFAAVTTPATTWTRDGPNESRVNVTVEEIAMGLPPALT